ncbi:tyrosine-protein phosphatase [Gordonia sihwensis]|uniref:tyrosine-protein phosphatase n=1 Tax=Gordonia sihwensis TaxID=173559 RepID=UPI0005EEC990|nr:tyrosine-protein phosphatase [Gordonia sihwensis]KJR06311.1 protein tyrosine phosphatase [Gordonia sihwensis]MBY4569068.1 protein-tyrosine-phosphatase [Gordonia sihwensis]
MTDQQTRVPGAPSPFPVLPNLRDLGGWVGVDGRPVRHGMLFRSTDFRSIVHDSSAVAEIAATLGLRTVYDLRSAGETEAMPDPVWADVAEVHLDVLADAQTAVPANLATVLTDPAGVAEINRVLESGGAISTMAGTYRQMITLDSAKTGYRRFYEGLLGEDRSPALFHCTTGKDRTGWASASFLSLMGVARDDVFSDYLLTNDRLVPALAPVFEKFTAAGGDVDALRQVLGVRPEYLEAAFDEVDRVHGGMEAYFAEALGIDSAAQSELRERFLEA